MHTKIVSILIVEDDLVDVMSIERAFKKCKVLNPILNATNGMEALAMLRGESARPMIILLDLNMPLMNGIEFLHELRTDPQLQDIPVVVLTTSDEEIDIVNAYKYNVAGYIIKPIDEKNFGDTIAILQKYWLMCELP